MWPDGTAVHLLVDGSRYGSAVIVQDLPGNGERFLQHPVPACHTWLRADSTAVGEGPHTEELLTPAPSGRSQRALSSASSQRQANSESCCPAQPPRQTSAGPPARR